MTSVTIDSGIHRMADTGNDGKEPPGMVARSLRAASDLVSVCRHGAALAMMSERELDDLGLLPSDVRSEDWRKESAATPRPLAA